MSGFSGSTFKMDIVSMMITFDDETEFACGGVAMMGILSWGTGTSLAKISVIFSIIYKSHFPELMIVID